MIRQKSGKLVHAWALEGDLDIKTVKSNTFELEWPPKSGRKKEFPEIDKAEWLTTEQALEKIIPAQQNFIVELKELLEKR
jgi:predicted NUDIX family NTP pyrophosphohydrolase